MKMVYVDGNFIDSNTFEEIEKQKQQKRRPADYGSCHAEDVKAHDQPDKSLYGKVHQRQND